MFIYNELYECIDEFGINVRKEIVEPINRGENEAEVLEAAADKVWAYYQKHKHNGIFGEAGTVELKAKRNDNGLGKWDIYGKRLILNIDGEHSDLRAYLPTRLSRFVAMCQEYHLKNSLVSLGYEVREANTQEDCLLKVDLFVMIEGTEYAVSVFRDTQNAWEKAYEKLESCRDSIKNRVSFAFDRYYNNTTNIEHVLSWAKAVANNKNRFGGNQYVW